MDNHVNTWTTMLIHEQSCLYIDNHVNKPYLHGLYDHDHQITGQVLIQATLLKRISHLKLYFCDWSAFSKLADDPLC
jgi:hypothetical protein